MIDGDRALRQAIIGFIDRPDADLAITSPCACLRRRSRSGDLGQEPRSGPRRGEDPAKRRAGGQRRLLPRGDGPSAILSQGRAVGYVVIAFPGFIRARKPSGCRTCYRGHRSAAPRPRGSRDKVRGGGAKPAARRDRTTAGSACTRGLDWFRPGRYKPSKAVLAICAWACQPEINEHLGARL